MSICNWHLAGMDGSLSLGLLSNLTSPWPGVLATWGGRHKLTGKATRIKCLLTVLFSLTQLRLNKWPPFYRQHFIMYFLQYKINLNSDALTFVS